MRKVIGTALLGLVGGYLLSRLRAMPGGDALDWSGPEVGAATTWRVLALVVVGLAAWNWRSGVSWFVLAAVAAGFAAHGLAFGPVHGIPWLGLLLAGVIAFFGARLRRDKQVSALAEEGAHPTNLGEMFGLFLAGGGAAIALESVARHVRLFGAGLAQDDTVFGLALLVFVAFGAAAFGWIVGSRALRRLSFPVLLAGSAAACFASLAFIDVIADGRGMRPFLERWHMRDSDFATLRWDALIGSASFVAPALLLGAALAGARGKRSVPSAILGAAVGLAVVPRLFDHGSGLARDAAELFSAQIVPIATLIAIGGAALALLSATRRKPRARYLALLLLVPCGIPPLTKTVKPIMVLSPWESRPILPYLGPFECPAGLASVEPSRSNLKVATLDRHLLTPDLDELEADSQRIRDSFALLSSERRARGQFKVLFVGQMSAVRADALATQGAVRVDRSAAWWKSMARLESELFAAVGTNPGIAPPAGDIVSPKEARERIDRGDYDLVIAMPMPGDAPTIAEIDAPAGVVVVRWLALDESLRGVTNPETAWRDGDHELRGRFASLSAVGLLFPTFGIATNATLAPSGDPLRARLVPFTGHGHVSTPLAWLLRPESLRAEAARAAAFASAATGHELGQEQFLSALNQFYSAQRASSPFESPAERVELSDGVLETLERATKESDFDTFLRSTWTWIGRVLVEKRDIQNIDRFIAPLAAAHAPWPELEIALAYADLEGLDPRAAVARLTPLTVRDPSDVNAWFALGEALEIAGDAAGAAHAFEEASKLAPQEPSLRRRLAMAACRAGDPKGRQIAQEILTASPKDAEIKAYLEPGPPPAAPTSYQPRHTH